MRGGMLHKRCMYYYEKAKIDTRTVRPDNTPGAPEQTAPSTQSPSLPNPNGVTHPSQLPNQPP